ncbi:hypothetical protein SAMN02927923_03138 [Microvirga guangxiensis]|uniref:Uncharacterized protein n=1 Tax=Microvirga guangxiensis TaxID=549386 RepID=A0A1G5K9E4_9HYPH|nr:hypothetical protein SAMN02927923_03138 [Microvirga guangxiensis]
MRQVNVEIVHLTGIDVLPAGRVRLVGQTHLDAVDLGQYPVELRGGRSAGPDPDLERFAALVRPHDASREGERDFLRIPGSGEAAHPDIRAGGDKGGRLVRRHNPVSQDGIQDPSTVSRTPSSASPHRAGHRSARAGLQCWPRCRSQCNASDEGAIAPLSRSHSFFSLREKGLAATDYPNTAQQAREDAA